MISAYLISTNYQKVLRFLLLEAGRSFYEREIARNAGLSPSSAHYVLSALSKAGLINCKRNGRMCFYSIDATNPYLKGFRLLVNLLLIEPLAEKLKRLAHKIILFGSWADGTNTEDSDIDLFIVSSEKERVLSLINKSSGSPQFFNRKIQPIVVTPQELLRKTEKDKVFMEEVAKGNTIWEKEINEDIL